jgi:mRNA-degrading endonuclease HigB of HigAB toxin-antitoxin module
MYAGENFSPDGNYLMISTIQNHFPILFLSILPKKTVIYDKEGNEVKVVNEVAFKRNYAKRLYGHPPVKEIWIGEMTSSYIVLC